MDLIDRQALLKQIEIDSDGEPGYYGDTWKFIDTIKNLPSATDKNVGTKLGTNLASLGTDCISRQAAIDAVMECYDNDELFEVYEWKLNELPPIQPKRGRWHYSDGKPARIGSFGVVCDQCDTESEYCTNFCGECGADMRGEQDG